MIPSQGAHAQGHYWDAASEHASPAEVEIRAVVTALLKPADWEDRAVLDAGCGNGDYAAFFERSGARSVSAIDVSAGSLRTARRNTRTASAYQASLSELPFPTAAFDTIWSWGVLHYVPDPTAALREIGRTLRPGGRAVIHTRSAHILSRTELAAQRVLSGAPKPLQTVMMTVGSGVIDMLTRIRTGQPPGAHTAKSTRQKLQEKIFVPGHQHIFTVDALSRGFGVGFTVMQADPPVASLLSRDLSLTVIVEKRA